MTRHRNDGLRKRCRCARRQWSKCAHPWYFAYQWRGKRHRVSLERLLGRQLKGKTDAEDEADRIRGQIRAGTFQNEAPQPQATAHSVTVSKLGTLFLERSKARGKVTWRDDEVRSHKFAAFVLPRTDSPIGALSVTEVTEVTEDDCEVFLTSLRERHLAASTRNKHLPAHQGHVRVGRAKGVPGITLDPAGVRFEA